MLLRLLRLVQQVSVQSGIKYLIAIILEYFIHYIGIFMMIFHSTARSQPGATSSSPKKHVPRSSSSSSPKKTANNQTEPRSRSSKQRSL